MIGKLFHLAHLVEDLDATDRLYDEVFEDPHFVARGFQVEVEHPELGRSRVAMEQFGDPIVQSV